MHPELAALLPGIASKVLLSLAPHIICKGGEMLLGSELREKFRETEQSIHPILQKALLTAAEDDSLDEVPDSEKICLFLTSPEVETIARQIFSLTILGDTSPSSLDAIQDQFNLYLRLFVEQEGGKLIGLLTPQIATQRFFKKAVNRRSRRRPSKTPLLRAQARLANQPDVASYLFGVLVAECERCINEAIAEGKLIAHEAKSSARHRILMDELSNVHKAIAMLNAEQAAPLVEILDFEHKYRRQVAERHRHIVPPHFDGVRKIPINDLYVSPNLIEHEKYRVTQPTSIDLETFLPLIYRTVILGNPGGGKSTLATKICYEAAQEDDPFIGGRYVTPVLVILREYGVEKKARGCSILEFIETTAKSRYQVSVPLGAFEYLFLSGRAAVIFDGLDELLDTGYRQEISGDVESFCTLYPSVPVIVTSREVGYEQAPLSDDRFEVVRLAPFTDEQVRVYVGKWFATDDDLTHQQQHLKAEKFFGESSIVSDIRSNPLMLALMCNIYRGESYIPKNRPDVYEKCALMLFERWDKSRGILVPLPFEAHISPAMMYLAHWIYADDRLQSGVSEAKLVAETTNYLHSRRFEDEAEANKAAREFINFCRGRAWVFTDTGTTAEGNSLYQFTHRTFLEYFTAAHLVRINPTPQQLWNVLQPKIAKGEWDVVAQLAYQIQSKNVEGAGDHLLAKAIEQTQSSDPRERWICLHFAARCLGFIIPSPQTRRAVSKIITEEVLAWGLSQLPSPDLQPESSIEASYALDALSNLQTVAIENLPTVTDSVEKILSQYISYGSDKEALIAYGILRHIESPTAYRDGVTDQRFELYRQWRETSEKIRQSCSSRLKEMIQKHLEIARYEFLRDNITVSDFVGMHGMKALFLDMRSLMPSSWQRPLAVHLIEAVMNASYFIEDHQERVLTHLKEVSRLFSDYLPRRIDRLGINNPLRWAVRVPKPSHEQKTLSNPEVTFGVFALLAIFVETTVDTHQESPINSIRKWLDSYQEPELITIVDARLGGTAVSQTVLHNIFLPQHQDIVYQWTQGGLSFTE